MIKYLVRILGFPQPHRAGLAIFNVLMFVGSTIPLLTEKNLIIKCLKTSVYDQFYSFCALGCSQCSQSDNYIHINYIYNKIFYFVLLLPNIPPKKLISLQKYVKKVFILEKGK